MSPFTSAASLTISFISSCSHQHTISITTHKAQIHFISGQTIRYSQYCLLHISLPPIQYIHFKTLKSVRDHILTNINSKPANKIQCLKHTNVFKYTQRLYGTKFRNKYLSSVCVTNKDRSGSAALLIWQQFSLNESKQQAETSNGRSQTSVATANTGCDVTLGRVRATTVVVGKL